jgi:hypothetical protein
MQLGVASFLARAISQAAAKLFHMKAQATHFARSLSKDYEAGN